MSTANSVALDSTSLSAVDPTIRRKSLLSHISANERRRSSSIDEERSSFVMSDARSHSTDSDRNTSLAIQEKIFTFMNKLRNKTHWLSYVFLNILLALQSITLAVPYQVHWGSVFKDVFRYFNCIKTFGLNFIPYIAIQYLIGIVASYCLLIFLGMVLCYWYYTRGNHLFIRMKQIVCGAGGMIMMFGLPIISMMATTWSCNPHTGWLNQYKDHIVCYGTRNVAWSIVSLTTMIFVLLIMGLLAARYVSL
jgi:hypothetical protein